MANSKLGESFEVKPNGEIVRRFLSPETDSEGHRATIVRIKRYPVDFVEALMSRSSGAAMRSPLKRTQHAPPGVAAVQ